MDLLLAPALAVIGGKVVSFCSDRCRQDYLDQGEQNGEADGSDSLSGPGAEARRHHSRGLMSWLKGRSSRVLFVVAAASVGVLGVVGYHLACVMRYRPAVTASWPAEAAPPKKQQKEPVAPAVVLSPTRRSASSRSKAPSRSMVLGRARAVAHELLHQDGYRLQIAAAEALMRCCRQDVGQAKEVLLEQASHGLWTRRRLAAEALARAGVALGKKVLVEDLTSPRRSVRLSAALSLARLGDRRALPVLRTFVGAKRYQLTCAEALVHLGSDKAKRILWRTVRSKSERRPDRIRAAAALAGAGDAEAARALAALVSTGAVGWPELLAMGRAGVAGTHERLVEALRFPALRLQAARILFARKMKADPRVLWSDLVAPDEEARATAAVAALWLGMEAR